MANYTAKSKYRAKAEVQVCLSIPVGTASVERSFSQMKMIKIRLRNHLGEQNLAHLMRIAIETPEKLPDNIVESVVDIWNRKTSPSYYILL